MHPNKAKFLDKAILTVCICTYKRPELLSRLIDDIARQSLLPDCMIVVDGDPNSGEVKSILREKVLFPKLLYIQSNHSNLAYQRYLGWCSAKMEKCEVLLYLDDDLRIEQYNAIEKVIAPLLNHNKEIVGVTAKSKTGDRLNKFKNHEILINRGGRENTIDPFLVRLFGAARKVPPGGLSPSGHRRFPEINCRDYVPVRWLQGRVMAYKMDAFTQECFSADLFALTQIGCGLGEDTFLSMKVGSKGDMLFALCAQFLHPDNDLPNSYPIQPYRYGYASAYSRRLLNDHYRGFKPPLIKDRIALLKSYIGTTMLNWFRAVTKPKGYLFLYAFGYSMGALRGILQKPTASSLTPDIDWWGDAEKALEGVEIIQGSQPDGR